MQSWEQLSPPVVDLEEAVNSSLYIGATGMKGLAQGMQVTSNNLANLSTIGYKQQNILFCDTLYQAQAGMGGWWNNQDNSRVAVGQVGMGLMVETVRTIHTEGPKESTNIMTDLAINGKGFFQVSDESGRQFYTRAGDFQTDAEGVWRTPSGLALNGYRLNADGSRGELSSVQVDRFSSIPAKATSNVELSFNLSSHEDKSVDAENPFFGLLQKYDASGGKPLDSSQYASSQQITIYDENGQKHTMTAYFDGAGDTKGRYMEFVIANDEIARADAEGNPIEVTPGAGLLMSGVLEFDTTGKLVNISTFSPAEAGSKDLAQWQPSSLANGQPLLQLGEQAISLNFGLAPVEGWVNPPESAAAIGADATKLASVGEDARQTADFPTNAYKTSAMTSSYKQDGYEEGTLNNLSVGTDGVISGFYSNGQTLGLWEIPLARFTSEDGLYREGGNLFSATEESGQMELGAPGSENFGEVLAYNIEVSNVDVAQEFVNMIITQRGFQSNSKVVTTADQLLQKAMELKRQ